MTRLDRLFENFENVEKPKECQKTGLIPSWLKGTMVRNGPGMFQIGDTAYDHWFDGLAYIQRYHFQDGKMYYSARYLESNVYKKNLQSGRIVTTQFGTLRHADPCKNIFQKFFSHFSRDTELSDNCLVAFTTLGDKVYALTETPKMVEIDLDTLDAKNTVDVNKYIAMNTYSAHHHGDYEGNTYNIGSKFGKTTKYVFSKTPNPKNIKGGKDIEGITLIGELAASGSPTYYHSFGMSENYMLLFEAPVRMNTMKLLMVDSLYSFRDTMAWDDKLGVNVLIMDKRTGKQINIKIKSDPFFSFHFANTFEKDGYLVTDYCKMRNPGTFDDLLMEHMRSGTFATKNPDVKPYLTRMIIPLSIPKGAKPGDDLLEKCPFARDCVAVLLDDGSIRVNDMRLCESSMEFPRYNYEHYNMIEYKYVYGTSVLFDSNDLVGIVKINVQDGTYIKWDREKSSHMCAEPIFVPKPGGKAEDDGILIVPVITSEDGENPFVSILDAATLKESARLRIPESRIPLGFHAQFSPRN